MNIHQSMLPIIALVPGDCTGIGPEQTARILADGNLADVAHLVVVGDARVLEMGMEHAGVRLDIERVASPRQASRASRAATPAIARATRGSAHHQPNRALASRKFATSTRPKL